MLPVRRQAGLLYLDTLCLDSDAAPRVAAGLEQLNSTKKSHKIEQADGGKIFLDHCRGNPKGQVRISFIDPISNERSTLFVPLETTHQLALEIDPSRGRAQQLEDQSKDQKIEMLQQQVKRLEQAMQQSQLADRPQTASRASRATHSPTSSRPQTASRANRATHSPTSSRPQTASNIRKKEHRTTQIKSCAEKIVFSSVVGNSARSGQTSQKNTAEDASGDKALGERKENRKKTKQGGANKPQEPTNKNKLKVSNNTKPKVLNKPQEPTNRNKPKGTLYIKPKGTQRGPHNLPLEDPATVTKARANNKTKPSSRPSTANSPARTTASTNSTNVAELSGPLIEQLPSTEHGRRIFKVKNNEYKFFAKRNGHGAFIRCVEKSQDGRTARCVLPGDEKLTLLLDLIRGPEVPQEQLLQMAQKDYRIEPREGMLVLEQLDSSSQALHVPFSGLPQVVKALELLQTRLAQLPPLPEQHHDTIDILSAMSPLNRDFLLVPCTVGQDTTDVDRSSSESAGRSRSPSSSWGDALVSVRGGSIPRLNFSGLKAAVECGDQIDDEDLRENLRGDRLTRQLNELSGQTRDFMVQRRMTRID